MHDASSAGVHLASPDTNQKGHHMSSTEPAPTGADAGRSIAAPDLAPRRRGTSPDYPTWGDLFDESAALISAPAFFGPPIAFLMGPWLLLVLLLAGPFALIFTIPVAYVYFHCEFQNKLR